VRDLLGHAFITTTEHYDNQTLANLQLAAASLDRGLRFDPPARESAPPSKCQVSVKNEGEAQASADTKPTLESGLNSLKEKNLESWLGGRDLNPDNVVQRRKK
jgi:hypothetical protein